MFASKATTRTNVYGMIRRASSRRRHRNPVGGHTFRATRITAYLKNGGRLEVAQTMAEHETPRTTALYDGGEVTLEEVEKVRV